MKLKTTLALAVLALASGLAFAQQQGVSKNEILIGTIQDMSGPLAGYGKQAKAGMQLRIDELNEQQGSIHGRKLRLIAEDDGYDPKKAVLAAQKLVNQDKVFIIAGHLGTAQNMAAMPVQFEKNIVNFFPITAAREMYEPLHKLKYSFAATYYDQLRIALPKLVKEKNAKKVCVIYQDDDFGQEVLKGGEAGLKSIGMDYAEKTSYKRGATDFSSQVAKMKAGGCEMVVLGTIIRETIGTVAEARKTGFNPVFIGSSALYTDLIHKLGLAADALLGQQVQDQVQRRSDGVLGLRLQHHGFVHQGGAEGRSQPDHRQLRQGDGQHDLRARHVRRRQVHLHPHQAPGQRPVAAVADPERQVGRGVGLRQALSLARCSQKPPPGGFFHC
jgi:ABC-type branched-subunit amino acid transport system substrate-binding protein